MIKTLIPKSTYQTNSNFPKHAAMVVLVSLTGFTQTACGSDTPNAVKLYQKNLEELKTDKVEQPFASLNYVYKADARTAKDFKEKFDNGRVRDTYSNEWNMFKNGDVYLVTTNWPVEAAIKLTKQMKQEDCIKDIKGDGIRYKCFVTVDNLSKVMPDLKQFYSNLIYSGRRFEDNNSLKGVIILKSKNNKIEFSRFDVN